MSEINPSQSAQTNPIAGGSQSNLIWEIWVRPSLDVYEYHSRFLNISSPDQLTAALNHFKPDNSENLAELFFLREGVTSGDLHPDTGVGKWVNWILDFPEGAMNAWKNGCKNALQDGDVNFYGLKLETYHNGLYEIVRWVAN